jgi:hypothetical protein
MKRLRNIKEPSDREMRRQRSSVGLMASLTKAGTNIHAGKMMEEWAKKGPKELALL